MVVDVPDEAAQHGLLAHEGRHVDGGGLGVNQQLAPLTEGGLSQFSHELFKLFK